MTIHKINQLKESTDIVEFLKKFLSQVQLGKSTFYVSAEGYSWMMPEDMQTSGKEELVFFSQTGDYIVFIHIIPREETEAAKIGEAIGMPVDISLDSDQHVKNSIRIWQEHIFMLQEKHQKLAIQLEPTSPHEQYIEMFSIAEEIKRIESHIQDLRLIANLGSAHEE